MTFCSEFLRIMDDFSSNSCDSIEMIERVKSLGALDAIDAVADVDDDEEDERAWLQDAQSTAVGTNGFEDVLQHVNLSSEEERPLSAFMLEENDEHESDSESTKSDSTDSDDRRGVCWGEADEQNILDIDHRAICDKSNRFLGQWNDQEDLSRLSTGSTTPTTPPPRDVSPVADTTRMVNHILASCLKKRKLHVPYKHQVKLINFSPVKPVAPFSVSTVDDDDDFTIRPTTAADPIIMPPSLGVPTLLASQTPKTSKLHDVQQLRVGIQPTKDKKIETSRNKPGPKMKTTLLGEKRKHSLISLSSPSALNFSPSTSPHGGLTSDDDEVELDMMVVDQDILDLGNSITASMSRIVRPKQECLPLPDFGNMPQDLRELKLKIEATESKVEGTKHRHRKGGPCPRCQVQNQLRAAKRALLCRMKRYK
ncbi:hypothetical protein AC1031_007779 [Aphanomyces cochlioides]|nr:hypothetical protein AC1031_007779 [Aphanomyces cochlioides]